MMQVIAVVDAVRSHAHIAVNAFGLGARAAELADCAADPQGWLLAQLERPKDALIAHSSLKNSAQYIIDYSDLQAQIAAIRKQGKSAGPDIAAQRQHKKIYAAELGARQAQAVTTPTPFAERWARFWCNHFNVSGRHSLLMSTVGSFEREAIRPNVFSNFETLLSASTFHPAMQIYLDNNYSYGPNSPRGKRLGKSYNENLAREVLELHTLGVHGGYKAQDIIALANALTGWTVSLSAKRKDYGNTFFQPDSHEPAAQMFMGAQYEDMGDRQAGALLTDIAQHPSTARFIATKIAKHFICNTPSKALISKLQSVFLETRGDLTALARALVTAPESWIEFESRFKPPQDYAISVARALNLETIINTEDSQDNITQTLGQAAYLAPSPQGWLPSGKDWINAENLLQRIIWLSSMIGAAPSWINEAYLIQTCFDDQMGKHITPLLNLSAPREDLLRSVFMSPAFLRY